MPIEQKRTSLAESASAFGNIGCRHVDEMNVDGFRFAAELLYAEIGQNFGQLADFSVVTDGFHLNQRADGFGIGSAAHQFAGVDFGGDIVFGLAQFGRNQLNKLGKFRLGRFRFCIGVNGNFSFLDVLNEPSIAE